MASINFPAYGTIMTTSFSEAPVPNVLRTPMESGYQKQAKRTSKTLITRDVTYLFSSTEYNNFKTWFFDTAAAGASFFNWTDPIDSVVKDARIIGGAFSARPVTSQMTHYYVSFQVETYR